MNTYRDNNIFKYSIVGSFLCHIVGLIYATNLFNAFNDNQYKPAPILIVELVKPIVPKTEQVTQPILSPQPASDIANKTIEKPIIRKLVVKAKTLPTSAIIPKSIKSDSLAEPVPNSLPPVTDPIQLSPPVVSEVTAEIDYSIFANHIASLVNSDKTYPRLARMRGISGDVLIGVDISNTGEIIKIEVAKSSGHMVLDNSAVDMVKEKASEIASYLNTQKLDKGIKINIPVSYKLI